MGFRTKAIIDIKLSRIPSPDEQHAPRDAAPACPVTADDARRIAQKIEAACDYPEGMCFTCEQDVAKLNATADWLEAREAQK